MARSHENDARQGTLDRSSLVSEQPVLAHKYPGGTPGSGPTFDDGFQRSNWSFLVTELVYKTDARGKIG